MAHSDSASALRKDPAPLRVAILLFDEVEVLDLAGPFEVFAVARAEGEPAFELITVALRPGQVVARNGLTVVPICTPDSLGPVPVFAPPGVVAARHSVSSGGVHKRGVAAT